MNTLPHSAGFWKALVGSQAIIDHPKMPFMTLSGLKPWLPKVGVLGDTWVTSSDGREYRVLGCDPAALLTHEDFNNRDPVLVHTWLAEDECDGTGVDELKSVFSVHAVAIAHDDISIRWRSIRSVKSDERTR